MWVVIDDISSLQMGEDSNMVFHSSLPWIMLVDVSMSSSGEFRVISLTIWRISARTLRGALMNLLT